MPEPGNKKIDEEKNIAEVITLNNMANGPEIPMGLGMALAQNLPSMNYFSSLSQEQQKEIIDQTHRIQSKEEMQIFVDSLAKGS